MVERDGRKVHIRDYGGEGPLLLLWHGAGCDRTIWDATVPHVNGYRVLAQDLPGHGGSPFTHFCIEEAITDAEVVVADLGLGAPILAGHSMGGWAALRFATTRPCARLACLDGPFTLDYLEYANVPDDQLPRDQRSRVIMAELGRIDVRLELAQLQCPTLFILCPRSAHESAAIRKRIGPARSSLADYLETRHPEISVKWLDTEHMHIVSMPRETGAVISAFAAAPIEMRS